MNEYRAGQILESKTETTLRVHATTGHVVDGFLLVRTAEEMRAGELGRLWLAADLRVPESLVTPTAALL